MPFFLVYMQTRGPVADLSPGGEGRLGDFGRQQWLQTDYKGGLDACVISSPPSPPNSKTGKGKKHIGYEEKNSENCGIAASNLPPFKSSAPVPSFRLR